jgi:hypothetical protein
MEDMEDEEDEDEEDDEEETGHSCGGPSELVGSSLSAASTFAVNSSCVMFDKDVWSIDSMNCTAPIRLDR